MSGHLHTLLVLCLLISLALAAKKPGKKPGKPNKPSKPSKPSKPTATVATFEASRDVTAKGKVFSCKYLLTYKAAAGKLAVDKKRSKVAGGGGVREATMSPPGGLFARQQGKLRQSYGDF